MRCLTCLPSYADHSILQSHHLLATVHENVPGVGRDTHQLVRDTIGGYNKTGKQAAISEVMASRPAIKQTLSEVNKLQRLANTNNRAMNQTRYGVAIETLDQLWGSRDAWIPPWPKTGMDDPVVFDDLPHADIYNLKSISTVASNAGINLPELYQEGGVIFQAAQREAGVGQDLR